VTNDRKSLVGPEAFQPGGSQNPLPADTNTTEPKVKASTSAGGAGAAVGAFLVWVLQTYVFHGDVPDPVVALLYLVGPAAVAAGSAWVAGRKARHQFRLRPTERAAGGSVPKLAPPRGGTRVVSDSLLPVQDEPPQPPPSGRY
jgi:hypothetical protein